VSHRREARRCCFQVSEIQDILATEANTIVAVFIFLLAATAGQVDVEDVEDAVL
jgi:hypothetical protein